MLKRSRSWRNGYYRWKFKKIQENGSRCEGSQVDGENRTVHFPGGNALHEQFIHSGLTQSRHDCSNCSLSKAHFKLHFLFN